MNREENQWWRDNLPGMAGHTPDQDERVWGEADRRLRCLFRTMPERADLQHEDREDVLQAVLTRLQAPARLAALLTTEAPAHYVMGMLRNEVRQLWRKERRRQRAVPKSKEEPAVPDGLLPPAQAELNELCEEVRAGERRLSEDDRRIIELYYRGPHDLKEVAALLGIGVAAAAQRLSRAKLRLGRIIE